ncbi:unnamed protein product [Larinioides sclopetarius]|uniref:Uncharacterized protein n=1 Tax=Larinioides sclopetarius TaxID=280406 RepID=A0AAV1ZAW7_9ARAC
MQLRCWRVGDVTATRMRHDEVCAEAPPSEMNWFFILPLSGFAQMGEGSDQKVTSLTVIRARGQFSVNPASRAERCAVTSRGREILRSNRAGTPGTWI